MNIYYRPLVTVFVILACALAGCSARGVLPGSAVNTTTIMDDETLTEPAVITLTTDPPSTISLRPPASGSTTGRLILPN
jgi:hypothetical protein